LIGFIIPVVCSVRSTATAVIYLGIVHFTDVGISNVVLEFDWLKDSINLASLHKTGSLNTAYSFNI